MEKPPDPATDIPKEWLEEFEAAARRPLEQRMKYAFIKTYRPVMDDAFSSLQIRQLEVISDPRNFDVAILKRGEELLTRMKTDEHR